MPPGLGIKWTVRQMCLLLCYYGLENIRVHTNTGHARTPKASQSMPEMGG